MANLISYCCNGYSWAIRSILLGITGSGTIVGDFLLQEDGFYLLQENDDKIKL